MKTKSKVIDIIRVNEALIKSYGVRRLGVFGSVARGEQHSKSDVDLLVDFQKGNKTFDNFILPSQ